MVESLHNYNGCSVHKVYIIADAMTKGGDALSTFNIPNMDHAFKEWLGLHVY